MFPSEILLKFSDNYKRSEIIYIFSLHNLHVLFFIFSNRRMFSNLLLGTLQRFQKDEKKVLSVEKVQVCQLCYLFFLMFSALFLFNQQL